MSIYASVTGMVTKEGGLPALDARRERMGVDTYSRVGKGKYKRAEGGKGA